MRIALYLSVAYLALAAALIGLTSGCSSKVANTECFNIHDCGNDGICFLGTCRGRDYSIQQVYAELTAPNTNLTQQTESPLDLSTGYQYLHLDPALKVTGTVAAADSNPHDGWLIARRLNTLTGRGIVRRAPVDATGACELQVLPGSYDVSFVPSASKTDTGLPAAPGLPPFAFGTYAFDGDTTATFAYPSEANMVVVSGRVRYSSTDNGIDKALVTGTGTDAGGATVASCDSITDTTGTYTLVFPPGTTQFWITVRPDGNPIVPETTVQGQPVAGNPRFLQDIVLDVSPIRVNASVIDSNSRLPVPLAAAVYGEGKNVGSLKGTTFATQLTSDASGNIDQATLLPGDYTITVVPAPSAPFALTSTQTALSATSGQVLELLVGPKVHLEGRVTANGGGPAVVGARVALTLRNAPATREYSTQTDAGGRYALDVDPGVYDFAVEPTLGSALPRYRVLASFDKDQTVDVELYRATFVYGRVLDQNRQPVSGVNLSFYSSDFSNEQTPLLLGLAITDSKGEFIVALPKPNGT